jgi:hypothetical protein
MHTHTPCTHTHNTHVRTHTHTHTHTHARTQPPPPPHTHTNVPRRVVSLSVLLLLRSCHSLYFFGRTKQHQQAPLRATAGLAWQDHLVPRCRPPLPRSHSKPPPPLPQPRYYYPPHLAARPRYAAQLLRLFVRDACQAQHIPAALPYGTSQEPLLAVQSPRLCAPLQ